MARKIAVFNLVSRIKVIEAFVRFVRIRIVFKRSFD
jgi:hypothetical protein